MLNAALADFGSVGERVLDAPPEMTWNFACLATHPQTAGSPGDARIATGQHDDDEVATPNTADPAGSAPTARFGLRRFLSAMRFESSYNETNLPSR
jgi:hypothetical protein